MHSGLCNSASVVSCSYFHVFVASACYVHLFIILCLSVISLIHSVYTGTQKTRKPTIYEALFLDF